MDRVIKILESIIWSCWPLFFHGFELNLFLDRYLLHLLDLLRLLQDHDKSRCKRSTFFEAKLKLRWSTDV